MQIITPSFQCAECDETITNPICGECLTKEMKVMVGEKDTQLAEAVGSVEIEGETVCILCGKGMALCTHCTCKGVHEFLEEKNPVIAKEFLSRFDFELRRELADFW